MPPPVIKAFAGRSMKTDPRMLGEMTVSMLKGEHGHQRKEFDKLVEWLRRAATRHRQHPELAAHRAWPGPSATRCGARSCHDAGRRSFLDGLQEPYRAQSLDLIRRQTADVDLFIAVSEYYVRADAPIPRHPARQNRRRAPGNQHGRLRRPATRRHRPLPVGYFARVAPEKGLLELAEAYRMLRHDKGLPRIAT